MASKDKIKYSFITELLNTDEYKIVLKIKDYILNEIACPNIQEYVFYNFETEQTPESLNIIKLCMLVEFGFIDNNISNITVVIDMKKFLI